MNKYSYTKINTFSRCKKQYKDKYITRRPAITTQASPSNSRLIGQTLHLAADSWNDYIGEYLKNFKFRDNEVYNELYKIQRMRSTLRRFLYEELEPDDNVFEQFEFEYTVRCSFWDNILDGTIDLVVWRNDERTKCDIVDFKFSSADNFDPLQLNFYKYILNQNGIEVSNMYFFKMTPSKIKLKESSGETNEELIKRINELKFEPKLIKVPCYEKIEHVILGLLTDIERETKFEYEENKNCRTCTNKSCKYNNYKSEIDLALSPKIGEYENELIKVTSDENMNEYIKLITETKTNLNLIDQDTTISKIMELSRVENSNIIIKDLCSLNAKYKDSDEYLLAIISLLKSNNKISAFITCSTIDCQFNGSKIKEDYPTNLSKLQKRYFIPYF